MASNWSLWIDFVAMWYVFLESMEVNFAENKVFCLQIRRN